MGNSLQNDKWYEKFDKILRLSKEWDALDPLTKHIKKYAKNVCRA